MAVIYFFHIPLSLSQALYFWIIPLFLSGLLGFIHSFEAAGAEFKIFHWDKLFYGKLTNRALQFWLFSVSSNGVLAIDYIIIVKLLSAKDIVIYNVISKIFIAMLYGYITILSALWPILAEHYAKKTVEENNLAERALRKSIAGGVLYMTLATAAIVIFRTELVQLFRMQGSIILPVSLIVLFGVYGCVRVWTDTYGAALQSRNKMRIFLIQTPIHAVIAIAAMLLLARFNLTGVMLALIGSFLLMPSWLLPYYHYKQLSKQKMTQLNV